MEIVAETHREMNQKYSQQKRCNRAAQHGEQNCGFGVGLDGPAAAHEVHRDQQKKGGNGGGQKRKADVLLEEERQTKGGSGQKPAQHACGPARREGGAFVWSEALQQVKGDEDREDTVAVVRGMREDAVESEYRERKGEQQGHGPRRGHATLQGVQRDTPGEYCAEAAHHRHIEHVMEEDTAGQLDDGCLDQKGEWRMGKGKVTIRQLASGDAGGAVEHVANIEQTAKCAFCQRITAAVAGRARQRRASRDKPSGGSGEPAPAFTIRDESSRRNRGPNKWP